MSACDVSAEQQWFFTVSLASDSTVSEVFFEINVRLEDSTRTLGDSIDRIEMNIEQIETNKRSDKR